MWKIMKNISNNLGIKSGIVYLIAELVTRGISFLITPVFARILPTAIFADAKIFESWCYIIAPVLSVSAYQSIPRAKFDYGKYYKEYLTNLLVFFGVVTFFTEIILLFLGEWLGSLLGYEKILICFIPIYCLGYNSIQSIQIYDRQVLNYKRNILLTILGVIPGILVSVVAILLLKNRIAYDDLLYVRIFGFLGPTAAIGISLCISLIIKYGIKNVISASYVFKNSFPIMITILAGQIFFQAGTIITKMEKGTEVAAVLIMAMTVGYIMDILIHAIDNAWKPWMFEKLNTNEIKAVKKAWLMLMAGISTLVITLSLFAPELVLFLGGRGYEDSIMLVWPILTASLVNFVFIGYTSLEQYMKITSISGISSVLSAVFCIIVNYVLIKNWGVEMAPIALVISYSVGVTVHVTLVGKKDKNNILQNQKTLAIILACIVIQVIFTKLYVYSFLYRLIGFLLIIIALYFLLIKKS